MRLRTAIGLGLLAIAVSAAAAPIDVAYQGSILEGQPGADQGLPVFLTDSPNNVRFRFFVPDYQRLISLNSVDFSVDVYDDDDIGNTELGTLLFVLNGIGLPNIEVNGFLGLDGYTSSSPLNLPGSLCACELNDALLEIQGDGVFFIRVNRRVFNRTPDDFFVGNVSVALDGELSDVPEPATFTLLAFGLAAGVALRRRRSS